MINVLLGLLTGGVSSGIEIAKEHLAGKRARKQAKLDTELAITKAKAENAISLMQSKQAADIAWDTTSVEKSGWRAGWFTVVLSLPIVTCFIPGMDQYVAEGFQAIQENVPEWYQLAFGVAVASAFGMRELVTFMKAKGGVKVG